jgi:hypothetical protein
MDGSSDGDMLGAIAPVLGITDGISSTGTEDGTKDGSTLIVGVVGDGLVNGTPGSAGARLGPLVGIADGVSSIGTADGIEDGSALMVVVVGGELGNGTPGIAGALVGNGSGHGARNSGASDCVDKFGSLSFMLGSWDGILLTDIEDGVSLNGEGLADDDVLGAQVVTTGEDGHGRGNGIGAIQTWDGYVCIWCG